MDMDKIQQKLQENESIIKIYCMSMSSFNQHTNTPDNHTLRLFAKQLAMLKKCDRHAHSALFQTHPSLVQWLKLLNISPRSVDSIANKSDRITFHDMYNAKNEADLHVLLERNGVTCEEAELSSMLASFANLKKYYKNFESYMANKAANSNSNTNDEAAATADVAKSDRNEENATTTTTSQIVNSKHMNVSNPSVDTLSVRSVSNYSSQSHLPSDSVSPKSSVKSASSGKKPKVPTPPPSRKLSTHAPGTVPILANKSNSSVFTTESNATNSTHHGGEHHHNNNNNKQTPGDILVNDMTLFNASNMQRSTSHESHLRNKVHHGTTANFAEAFPKEQALIIQKINENIYDRQQTKNRANSTEVFFFFCYLN
jgi:hypothetical protein